MPAYTHKMMIIKIIMKIDNMKNEKELEDFWNNITSEQEDKLETAFV